MKKKKSNAGRKPKKPARNDISQQISNAALNGLAEIVNAERGMQSEVAKRLSRRLQTKIGGQAVGKWLDRDKARRQQPSLGRGLAMIEVGRDILAERSKGGVEL